MATCKECVHYELCKRIDYELEYHNKSIKEAEEELPIKCRFFKNKTDVIPVVRCKDCKHRQENPDINNTCYLTCNMPYGIQGTVAPDDYCSYGEKGNETQSNKN